MNFLSHYYRWRDKDSPYFHVGNILPDLSRKAGHAVQHRVVPEFEPESPQAALSNGIFAHIKDDADFHDGDFFHTHRKALRVQMEELLPETIKYKSFLGHIALEMLMDRALLRKESSSLADEFYGTLEKAEKAPVRLFFEKVELLYLYGPYCAFFSNFLRARYLGRYVEDDMFIYSLKRVYRRATRLSMSATPEELRRWLKAADAYVEQCYRDNF